MNIILKNRLRLLLNFGSWMGGDRDGHPYVTVELTKETLQIIKIKLLIFI